MIRNEVHVNMRVKDYTKIEVIFKASLDLILKEGIAGLTMSKLAKQAGLATGTVYIYFKNKEELLHKLYLKLRVKSQERLMKGYDEKQSFKNGFQKVWLNYLTHRVEHYEESVFLEQFTRSPYMTKEQKTMERLMKNPVYDLVKKGKREGVIKTRVEDEMLVIALLGFMRELANENFAKDYRLNNDRVEAAMDLSWEMMKT